MQYRYPPRLPAGSQERSAKARQDAEALFSRAAPTAEPSSAVVILKKRRSIASPGEAQQADVQEKPPEEVRAPRVHRVGPKEDEAVAPTSPVTEQSTAEPQTHGQVQVQAQPIAEPVKTRRRRRLHGPVSILRPSLIEAPGPAVEAPLQASASDQPASQEQGVGAFNFLPASSKAYSALLARIAKLEAEAGALRKQEAAKAIKWIQVAIRDYGLTRQDLGFR